MTAASAWDAEIVVDLPRPGAADRLARALAPEATREVPRAHTWLERPGAGTVRLHITARDTGALRAALNTYLGWIELGLATEEIVASGR